MLEDSREARAKEEARQRRIDEGVARVDDIFSQFDDGFYEGYRQDVVGLHQPDLDDQFARGNDQLTYALARAGTLNSTIAADKRGEMQKQYDIGLGQILSNAQTAADQLRAQQGSEKSNIISMLNSTANADRAANEALAYSRNLFEAQPSYNPIGDLFGGLALGIGNAYAGAQNQAMWDRYNSPTVPRSTSGSVRTVNG